jgi:AcrR family transcriptional regulator
VITKVKTGFRKKIVLPLKVKTPQAGPPDRNAAMKKSMKKKKKAPKKPRSRLAPGERSDQILHGAISFFAERGFGGQTRELALQLGISQGLLYRYFPTKELLIERIYEEVFLRRFKPEWDVNLSDRSVPMLSRLVGFYLDYATMLHDYEWGRIYLYSGLGGSGIARRFADHVRGSVFTRVIAELRHEWGLPDLAAKPMSDEETEMMWSLHGSIFYIGIRQSVYHVDPPRNVPATVKQIVESFFSNARALMAGGALARVQPEKEETPRG